MPSRFMDSLPTPLLPPVVVKATLMREDITPSASGWKYAEYRMSKNQMKEKVGASKIIAWLIHDRHVYVLCKNYCDDTKVHRIQPIES